MSNSIMLGIDRLSSLGIFWIPGLMARHEIWVGFTHNVQKSKGERIEPRPDVQGE